MKQLTPKEEELMRKLWTKDEMTVKELLAMYPEPRPHFNTVATVLKVLERKGWVNHRAIGNTYLFHAAYNEDETGRKSMKSIVSKFFNGSLVGMVSSLVKNENLSEKEIDELYQIISENKNKQS